MEKPNPNSSACFVINYRRFNGSEPGCEGHTVPLGLRAVHMREDSFTQIHCDVRHGATLGRTKGPPVKFKLKTMPLRHGESMNLQAMDGPKRQAESVW
jgi:hypothetical protein